MPLLIPKLATITDLHDTLGKKVVDESLEPDPADKDYPVENVVYLSQLPSNVIVLKQDVERTAITGALKSGYVPLIVDEKNVVVQIV